MSEQPETQNEISQPEEQPQQDERPQYNQAGQELGPDGAPKDAEPELIMTKQDGTVTTAEKENEPDDGEDA